MIPVRLLFFMGILVVVAARTLPSIKIDCPSPFTEVGGRCLHLEHITAGPWADMRQFCQELGGDLVNLADLQFYGDLILYIYSLDLPTTYFWTGATDERVEGLWEWTDGSVVRLGTPYWANTGSSNVQMPTGGTDQNCAMLDGNMHYYFNDYYCSEHGIGIHPICEI